ncbi:MAG: formylglycine-generating enzyme family protein [Planctomycetes bacterium]|nr:formylglycine-generating enzyme family protein [Planctomycetota bacterium]
MLPLACVAFLLIQESPAPSQAPGNLPAIDVKKHENYTEKINDKASFEMIAIPGGTYLMGSPDSEKGRKPDEGPQHPVTVKPFWIAKLVATWDEYDWFWSKRPGGPPPRPDISKKSDKLPDAITSPTPPYEDPTFGYGRDEQPVIAVTWHAAMEYCRWLSEKTGKKYRLPTEAEWEWACRAGTSTAYSFGDDPKKLGEYGWFEGNSDEKAQKVGKKKANPWGLFDMHGGVAEWCLDRYKKDFYASFPRDKATLNPFNPPGDARYGYVARGGSWIDPPDKCRSAARRYSEKDWLKRDPQRPQSIWWMTEADYVGFRVVRAVEEYEDLKGIRSKVTWWSD